MFDCIFLVSGVDSSHDRTQQFTLDTVSLERDGHVLVMGLNRPDKRNAFNVAMLADLSRAYALLESDDSLRAGVLFAHGDDFTSGLDLVDVGPSIATGRFRFPTTVATPGGWMETGRSPSSPPRTAGA